jgi:hypothetical protein
VKESARKLVNRWERFWWILWNIGFGAGYLAKIPIKRAARELGMGGEPTDLESFWYVVENIFFASGYLAKVVAKVALAETR